MELSEEELLLDSHNWVDSAKRLKISSEFLRDELIALMQSNPRNNEFRLKQTSLLQSHMMLMGFAIENLIKGYSIFRAQQIQEIKIDNFKILEKSIWQTHPHDVIKIAEKTGLELSDNEMDLITRYQEFAIWAGRYRIPKNLVYSENLSFKTVDMNVINLLFEKIISSIENKYKA